MIINLKPYPKMKDSGVEWLNEVPEHWDALGYDSDSIDFSCLSLFFVRWI
jgi:hypothetical protein